jgi:prepilin signal peptidase PulO-like enzyme (type II secretory pathway)
MNPVESMVAPSSAPGPAGRSDTSQSQLDNAGREEHRRDADATRKGGDALPWAAIWVVLMCLAAVANSGLVYASGGKRGFFVASLAMGVCVLAALFDAFTLRIPNNLTYTAALLGLALNGLSAVLGLLHADTAVTWLGAAGIKESLLGLLACGILGLLGNLAAGIHGGDLKLLAGLGAMLGLTATAQATLLALAAALAYAVINLALFGRLNQALRIGAQRALELFFLRRFETPMPDERVTATSHIPMAIPLALGMGAVLYLQARHGGGMLW